MRGDLSETSAAAACRGLGGDGATGTLALGGLDGPGHIVFEQGRIVSANAPTATARLGDRLVGAGFLTEAELLEVLEAQRSGDVRGRLGALLVERSLVTRDAIRLFVQEQTLDALFEVLRWRFGSFAFQPGLAEDRSGVRVAMPVDDVLLVVERRHAEWDELARTIPDLAAVPTFSTNASTVSASLEPDEFAVLASVDGDRDVRELAADLGYSELELARIVYGLTLLGVVDIRLPEDEIGAALDAALRIPPETAPTDGFADGDGIGDTDRTKDRDGTTEPEQTQPAEQSAQSDASPLARVIQLPTSRQRTADDRGAFTDQPPGDQPPANEPPANEPPANEPTDRGLNGTDPPGDEPTADQPTAERTSGGRAVERPGSDVARQPSERPPPPASDESSVQEQRAASMADLADTSTRSYPDILRELREHSSGAGRRSGDGSSGAAAEPRGGATGADPTPRSTDEPSSGTTGVQQPPQRDGPPGADQRRTGSAPTDAGSAPADEPRQAGDPDDDANEPQTPDSRTDRDVSEFLRELSRLAGDDEPATPRPPRPPDRSGSSSSSGSSGSTGDDDPKRRRRGLFGRS